MSDFLLQAFNAVSGEDFVERPVEIEEFVEGDNFLGQPPLSDIQYEAVRHSTQIYKYATLLVLYGGDNRKCDTRFNETCNEVVLQWGKGSGKDHISEISCAYIVYQLLCLKDPARYYGKPKGNRIDILNIAINAVQANQVFFSGFKTLIENSPWFEDKYDPKANSIEFDKNVWVHSGHSEREAWEGYNTFAVFLDEIAGFAYESNEQARAVDDREKTADAIYDMYQQSVTSRFADFGKLVLLSWPRFEGDFIQTRYNEVVAEKETIMKTHLLKLDPDLPDGTEGNEFEVEWEHDIITRYKYPRVYAIRRATWEVNPLKKIEDYTVNFFRKPGDTYGRVACTPRGFELGFFKNAVKIELGFSGKNGVDGDGVFLDSCLPIPGMKYYVHVDLAQKHDHCAVAMGHVDKWVEVSIGSHYHEVHPYVVVDLVRWWTPTQGKSVDFKDVRDFIMALRRRGFDLQLVTFDRWNSNDTMNFLEMNGIKTEVLSVAKKHYDDFLSVLYEDRLRGPNETLLKKELGELREVKGKIDHPRKGSKDLSDAVCGAIYNAVAGTPRPEFGEVEVLTAEDIRQRVAKERALRQPKDDGIIRPPKQNIPDELADYISAIKML